MGINHNPKPYLTKKYLKNLQLSGVSPEQIAAADHFSADRAIVEYLVSTLASQFEKEVR
jgi:hypothetical protein